MRKFLSVFCVLLLVSACTAPSSEEKLLVEKILVLVQRNYTPRPDDETASIVLDMAELSTQLSLDEAKGFMITDQHFGHELKCRLIDTDNDGKADKLAISYPFTSAEPHYACTIRFSSTTQEVVQEAVKADDRFVIKCLHQYTDFVKGDTITNWPDKIFSSSLNFYPDPATFTIISPGEWNYEHGFFLNAGFELWKRTDNEAYFNYIKRWVDRFLTEEGTIKKEEYDRTKYRLDDILPGRLCLFLYQETGNPMYKVAADQLKEHLAHQPRTTEGGYWHKKVYPNQMWLDGIYMADVFTAQYAALFNEPHLFDEAALQIKRIAAHTRDTTSGLLYHGWDESKNNVWADPVTGTSFSFWGRAIGWYFMALIEVLDYLPEAHKDRETIVSLVKELAKSLAAYQDKESALWYQVVDKGGEPGNWIETSSSAMFAYGFAKGYHKGLLDETYYQRARAAFDAIIKNYTWYDEEGNIYLTQTVKVGTLNQKVSKGDYAYYVSCERRVNDYKGLAALLYASMALSNNP